jgi:hypothetical protein
MNAEVQIFIDEALGVVLVPNNAIVHVSDVGPAALALGLDVDDLDLSAFMRAGGGTGGQGGGARGGAQSADEGQADAGNDEGAPAQQAPPAPPVGARAGAPQGAADTRARIQALRAQVEAGEITQDSMRAVMQSLAGTAGLAGGRLGGAEGTTTPETRPAAVFVMGADGRPEPRLVQLGLGDWDQTQVVSGVEPGEILVVVGAAQLQAQQEEFLERMRGRTGGNPFGGGGPGGGFRGRGGE